MLDVIFKEHATLESVDEVTRKITEHLGEHAIVFLAGDLAAGKTTLAQAIAKASGEGDVAASPTFALQHRYGDRLFHYDLYRIDEDEFVRLGLFEELDQEGWHLIEWGTDKLKALCKAYGFEVFEVVIEPKENARVYTMMRV